MGDQSMHALSPRGILCRTYTRNNEDVAEVGQDR